MQVTLPPVELHCKQLGFPSPDAAGLVTRDQILTCKTRRFAFCESKEGDYEVRFFKQVPQPNALTCYREDLVRDPMLACKGLISVDRNLLVKHGKQILCLCTKERTLLLVARKEEEDGDDVLAEWARVLQARARGFRPRSIMQDATPPITRLVAEEQRRRESLVVAPTTDAVLTYDMIWTDATRRRKFFDFLKFSYCGENFLFYEAVEQHLGRDASSFKSARAICDEYVRDSARDQVNLPSFQHHALIKALDLEETVDMGAVNALLADCQREIYDLMRRNCFHRFKALYIAEQRRERLLKENLGCFSQLFERQGGVDAFTALNRAFHAMQEENGQLLHMVGSRLELTQEYANKLLGSQPANNSNNSASVLTSVQAVNSVLEISQHEGKILQDFIAEMRETVYTPLLNLQRSTDAGYAGLKNLILPAMEGISLAREKLRKLLQEQAQANHRREMDVLNEAMLTLRVASPELALAGQRFEAIQRAANALEAALSDAEVELVSKESAVQGDLLGLFDQLESLAIYRLDTLREILQRLILCEQNASARLGLKLSATLDVCCNLDTMNDLPLLASVQQRHG